MKRTALLMGAAMALGFPQHGLAGTDAIAVTGEQAGGVGAGVVFDNFAVNIALSNTGSVAYLGLLDTGTSGVDTTNDIGLWTSSVLIAREGSQAGGVPAGAIFSEDFGNYVISPGGQVAYEGLLQTGVGGIDSTNNTGIWRDTTLIAREGSQAGGVPAGVLFSGSFTTPAINNSGQVAYEGFLQTGLGGVDSTNNNGIWRDATLIAREGDQAGGTPAGAVFNSFSNPLLNDAGQVAYEGFLQTGVGGVDSTNNNGIWRDATLIAREGDQAGGTPTGAAFSSFQGLALNNAGQVAYQAFLQTGLGGVDATNNHGIWRDATLIARRGSQAGGTPTGAVFSSFSNTLLNDAGQVAYLGLLQAGAGGVDANNDGGIWRGSTLIAREGSQAGGVPTGAVFSSFFGLGLNDAGQVTYYGTLQAGVGGVDASNDAGIWITGTNGETVLVIREGDTLAGRTVQILSSNVINDFSQVAYHAAFTDGERGLFLYTPEIHWTAGFSSAWDNASRWTLGQLPGDPHDVFIDPDGSLTVSGPTGDVALNTLEIGGGTGVATLALQRGGTIESLGELVRIHENGVLTGDGVIDSDLVINAGTVEADNLLITGALSNQNVVTGNGRLTTSLFNVSSGEVRVASGDRLQIMGNVNSTNFGRIEVIGGEIEFDHFLSNQASTGLVTGRDATMRFNGGLSNHGSVALSFGTSDLFGDILNNATGSIVLSGGSNTTFYDDVTNNGSIVVAAAGSSTSTAVFFGAVSGSGSITGGGNVFLHGDLRPGNSPAAVNHDVNLFLLGGATTQIEIGGTTPGSQHDQINNLKSTTLGGTLEVLLINGYDPEQGDTFDIFNFASHSGTFANVLLPTLNNDLGWHLGKLYTDGELHVELEGDLNQDGFVGVEDLDILLANWGGSALAFDYAAGDASGDGLVGAADLALVQSNWGNGTPGGGNVPEPGSFALLALGGLAVLKRRRRVV